jgi:hypothetical protein
VAAYLLSTRPTPHVQDLMERGNPIGDLPPLAVLRDQPEAFARYLYNLLGRCPTCPTRWRRPGVAMPMYSVPMQLGAFRGRGRGRSRSDCPSSTWPASLSTTFMWPTASKLGKSFRGEPTRESLPLTLVTAEPLCGVGGRKGRLAR